MPEVNLGLVGLIVSIVSIIIAATALIQSRKATAYTAALQKKQLERIEHEERERSHTRVTVALSDYGGGNYVFHIQNIGGAPAYDVNFELIDCPSSPLIAGDVAAKIPIRILAPASDVRLIAAMHLGSPRTYQARVSWKHADKSQASQELTLSA